MTKNDAVGQQAGYWPCKLAAFVVVILGLLLVAMGSGHIQAVISVAQGQDSPAGYRLVSLLATGGILVFPGLLGIVVSKWVWQGWDWAYAVCIFCASALMVYLIFLLLLVAPGSDSVGSELDYAAMVAGVYLATLIVVWASLVVRRRRLAVTTK